MVRLRRQEIVPPWVTRSSRVARPALQVLTPLVPEHAHQGEDEVRLVEVLALRVDADEDLGDLLLLDLGAKHKSGKWIGLEAVKTLERLGYPGLVFRVEWAGCSQPLEERLDQGVCRLRPHLTNVLEKGRISGRGCVGN